MAMHPLQLLTNDKQNLLNEIKSNLIQHATHEPLLLESYINDSLFFEKKRLESPSDPVRDAIDRYFWKSISKDLARTHGDTSTLKLILDRIVRYHLGEVCGHFDPRTYWAATQLVPRGFLWLLQAASVRNVARTLQHKMNIRDSIVIEGQLDQLRNLSKKATIIMVPTHFSNLDSLLIGWILYDIGLPPFSYGAGLNLFTNPVLGYFMNNLGAYKVDRKKKHKLYIDILKEYSTVTLERGCHSIFFPGGGRSRSGALEDHLKLGLLGTGMNAYIRNILKGKPNPDIYVVPCVISYNYVLEASGLIKEFLAEKGKSRFIPIDHDSLIFKSTAQFLFNFIKSKSRIHVNIGQALDLFGNLVDHEGNSLKHNGGIIDRKGYITSRGEICASPQRDQEYTRFLAQSIVQRYRIENIILSTHFVAGLYYKYLWKKSQSDDLYRFLRTEQEFTSVPLSEILTIGDKELSKLRKKEQRGLLKLERSMKNDSLADIIKNGIQQLGSFHSHKPIVLTEVNGKECLQSEDLSLLYYYHNRMLHDGT